MKVYAFDFDGTLTTRDTLIAIFRYARGDAFTLLAFLLYSPLLVLMKLHLYPNWKAKQLMFGYFFKGMKLTDFNDLCKRFAKDNRHLLRPRGMETVAEALREGSEVLVVSASLDNWVHPFFDGMQGHLHVLCTRPDVRNGVLTGKFITKNCYGSEKVRRIERCLPYREQYELIAFGDSRGDKEMLEYADKGYYKPFRR